MIKIQNTRTLNSKLVADAELVLIECKLEEALLFEHYEGAMFLSAGKFCGMGRHLKSILISRTEKIENNDWFYDKYHGTIHQYTGVQVIAEKYKYHFKILALPEYFSPKQLQMIVDGKLKEGKLVVECKSKYKEECDCFKVDITDGCSVKEHCEIIKTINLNPYITIYPVEEKMVPISLLEKSLR